jgi:carboxyl-terminal processing protease
MRTGRCRSILATAMLLAAGVELARAADASVGAGERTPMKFPSAAVTEGDLLKSGFDTIEQHFLVPIPRGQLEEKALAALLQSLDPYSTYLTAGEMQLFKQDLEESFGGIGVSFGFEDPSGYPRIEYLLHGGAAVDAGVRRDDMLRTIDGRDLKGLPPDSIFNALRGAIGSPVTVQVQRAGEDALMTFELKRVEIATPSVRPIRRDAKGAPDWWLDRGRHLGYMRVTNLAAETAATAALAMAELERGGARGLVMDLRDCTGGSMRAALDTADLFVDRGRLLTIRERGEDQRFDAAPGKYTRIPVAILINGGTASSGEILAAAIADNGRATLVGERSFGKGRIQVLYSLGEGRGGMKLSTGTFQRPNGKTIDKHDIPPGSKDLAGIAPDVEVKMGKAEHDAWLEFAEKTTGTLILTAEEQAAGAPSDPVLAKAVELLTKK